MRGEAITIVDSSKGLSSDVVRAVVADPAGGVWAGTAGGGLDRVTGDDPLEISHVAGLPSRQVSALHVDANGTLWVGTWGAGVARVRDGTIDSLSSSQGLTNDQVWSLGSDREGSVWIGTWVGGLNRLGGGRFLPFGTKEGLTSDNTRAVLQGRDGVLWVATAGGGLNRIEDGVATALRARDGLVTDEISTLAEASDGSLLVGTYTAGAFRVTGWRVMPLTPVGSMPSLDVRALLEARDGTVWLGTPAGLLRLSGGRLERGLPGTETEPIRVIGLLQDHAGTVWIATHEGLFSWASGRLQKRTKADGLASDRVLTLHEDVDGVLWVGTAGGLTRLAGGRFQSVTAADSLFDDAVQGIVDDGLGNLWLTCNLGLSRVRKRDVDAYLAGHAARVPFVAYGPQDGLRGRTFAGGQQPTAIRTSDGRLVFPSYRGLVIVDPRAMGAAPRPPAVIVEEVVAGDVSRSGPGPIELPPGTRQIELRYAAPTFVSPASLSFRYELDGVDPGPVEAGSRHRAFYTNLGPGTYTFRVWATNHEGVSSPGPTTIAIRIAPRFVETWPFRGALVAAFGAALFGAHRMRLAALRRRRDELEEVVASRTDEVRTLNAELERRVRERTCELEAALKELEAFTYTVSHDLRAPLRAIDGFAAMFLEDSSSSVDEDGRRRLGVVRASSQRMGELVDDLLTYTRIGRSPTRPADVDMEALVRRAWSDVRRDVGLEKGVELRVGSLPAGWGDPALLLKVWQELLSNAVKFSSKAQSPVVEITGEESGAGTAWHVRDNGAGFDMAYSGKLFRVFQRLHSEAEFRGLGVGLAIVQRIVDRHGGRVEATGSVGEGATVTFQLPRRPAPDA
jgi:signal transduction histidine kinase